MLERLHMVIERERERERMNERAIEVQTDKRKVSARKILQRQADKHREYFIRYRKSRYGNEREREIEREGEIERENFSRQ